MRALPQAFALLAFAATAAAQDAPTQQAPTVDAAAVARGKVKFTQTCAPCHGTDRGDFGRAMLPGTDALRIKYQGKLPAALEQRTDLTPAVIKAYVRTGTWSMPPFRKTELSDTQINEISAYIAAAARTTR
jgi:mono/diheme cytochrome c family protein